LSVCRNQRTGSLSLASKNKDFGAPPVFHNGELTVRCATIAYQVHKHPDASIISQPVMTFGDEAKTRLYMPGVS
jgi:hypothetical protein